MTILNEKITLCCITGFFVIFIIIYTGVPLYNYYVAPAIRYNEISNKLDIIISKLDTIKNTYPHISENKN